MGILKKERYVDWTQANELKFIESLGIDGPEGLSQQEANRRRLKMLRGYIASIPNRRKWFAGAKPLELEAHAQRILDRLETKTAA